MVASMTSSILLYTVRDMKDDVIASVCASPAPPDSHSLPLVALPLPLPPAEQPSPLAPLSAHIICQKHHLTPYQSEMFSNRFFLAGSD
jgi:hypothetical protein